MAQRQSPKKHRTSAAKKSGRRARKIPTPSKQRRVREQLFSEDQFRLMVEAVTDYAL
jgi:hypothetical protein